MTLTLLTYGGTYLNGILRIISNKRKISQKIVGKAEYNGKIGTISEELFIMEKPLSSTSVILLRLQCHLGWPYNSR